jgi:monofunctional glycosyltransferase
MSDDLSARRDDHAAFEHWDEKPRRRRGWGRLVVRVLILVLLAPLVLTLIYSVVPPPSTLMFARWATLRPVERSWVPIEEISPRLQRAVVAAEDARFCQHGGVDWAALRLVFAEGGDDGPSRGASTITMQTAKNLFLWNGFGYVRKPFEILLAQWIDLTWPKRRVLEVYLNIAEWGPNGVFGAEAGAQHGFGKPASQLTAREASLMAAALPNPRIRDTARPTRGLVNRANIIARRGADLSCLG